MKKVHVIFVSEDGVAALVCGVGSITRHFVAGFSDLAAELKERARLEVRLSLISHKPDEGAVGVRSDLLEVSEKTCASFGGGVHLIPTNRPPGADYFDFEQWRGYNEVANEIIARITREDESTIVLSHDGIFGYAMGRKASVINVWVPHSLAAVHAQSYVDGRARGEWEQNILASRLASERSYVGAISDHVERLLCDRAVPKERIVAMRNGFHFPLLESWKSGAERIRAALAARNIPTNKEIIFAFGRADEYKGLDIALEAMQLHLAENPSRVGVLIASRFSNEPFVGVFQTELSEIAKRRPERIHTFFGYEFELPKLLLQWPMTRVLLHLPTRDFAPLVPLEADVIGHDELLVLNSDIDCMRAEIRDGVDGLLVSPSPDTVARRISELDGWSVEARRALHGRGKARVTERNNLPRNYADGILDALERTRY